MKTPPLNPREVDYLERLSRGETIQEIALACHYEASGARSIGERIRKKLGAKTNVQAVFLACRAGLLDGRPQRHGDHAGYVAHTRRREPPCDACVAGELDYRAQRRQRTTAA